eukprot:gene811-815_t
MQSFTKFRFRKELFVFCTAILLLFVYLPSYGQSFNVNINGEVGSPLELTINDLAKYPQTTVVRKDKDGQNHTYTGVILSVILQNAGVTLGKDLRGKNLMKIIKVSARDNYEVVFALAELDKDFTDRAIILATQSDGKPLNNEEGPFRVIVQDEKKPARCVRQVKTITVEFVK